METTLNKNINLNVNKIDKSYCIDFYDTLTNVIKKFDNYNEETTLSIKIYSTDSHIYDFRTIDDLYVNLSDTTSIKEFNLFLSWERKNVKYRVTTVIAPNYEYANKPYLVRILITSNSPVTNENIFKIIDSIFVDGNIMFNNSSLDNLGTFNNPLNITTTSSKDERDYFENNDKQSRKSQFVRDVILLIIGSVVTLIFQKLFK